MEHIDGSAYFPVSTPHRISRRIFTSRSLLQLLHLATSRVISKESKLEGYYPRDVFTKKSVISVEGKEKLHFHQHTFDLQDQLKMLRSDVGATCVEQTTLKSGADYTKIGKQVFFTATQARKLLALLGNVRFGKNLYRPRLVTESDIGEIISLYKDQNYEKDDDIVFGNHRKGVAELLDLQLDTLYLTDTGGLFLSSIDEKPSVYMGVVNGLVDNEKSGLLRICFDAL